MKKQILLIGTIVILLTVGFSGCFEENNDDQDKPKDQYSEEVILTTDKNEYIYGEKLILTLINNKSHSIFNQGGPLPSPSPIKSFNYGLQKFINGSWMEFQLVRGETWKHIGDPVIQVVVDCIEYPSNSTKIEQISLTFFVYNDSGDYYENITPGKYRIVKGFYNECIDDFSLKNWSEPFTVYSNEFTITNSLIPQEPEPTKYLSSEQLNIKLIESNAWYDYSPSIEGEENRQKHISINIEIENNLSFDLDNLFIYKAEVIQNGEVIGDFIPIFQINENCSNKLDNEEFVDEIDLISGCKLNFNIRAWRS